MRLGHHIKHNLYNDDDECVGHFHTNEAAIEVLQTYEARKRTIEQMEEYVRVGSKGVNPRQVINLLSLTWPDGNYQSPTSINDPF